MSVANITRQYIETLDEAKLFTYDDMRHTLKVVSNSNT